MATLLLNHFNGSDGATTFTDEVPGITWDKRGSPYLGQGELDTAQQKFGSASLYIPSHSTTSSKVRGYGFSSPHSGDWTLEGWVRFDNFVNSCAFFGNDASDNFPVQFGSVDGDWYLYLSDSPGSEFVTAFGSHGLSTGVFYHMAVVRNSGSSTYDLYINGSRVTSQSSSTNVSTFDRIELQNGSSVSNCWFDEVRLTDEVKYTGATYTVPSAEFANAILLAPSSDTVSTTDSAALTTEILLVATDAVATSETLTLTTGTEFLLAEDAVTTSDSAALDTAILLESTDTVTTSDAAALTVPPTVVLVPPTGGANEQTGLNVGGVDKPAIPPTTDLPLAFIRVLEPMKQNIEIITGRRGGRIETLGDDATLEQVAEKVNQIVARLMQ